MSHPPETSRRTRDVPQPTQADEATETLPEERVTEEVRRAITLFQTGRDPEASFKLIFDTYYRPVQGFFQKRLLRAEICLDLTQETFLRIYKGLKGYRGEGPVGAWIFRIAWNVLQKHRARGATPGSLARPRQLDEGDEPEEGPVGGPGPKSAFDAVVGRERREILRQAVSRLPPKRRRCVTLWAYHDLSYEEIARHMGLSLGTVKAHLAQAREQLLELVEIGEEDRG
jgi:RNA polymerase sigma-70 factor (ECF subfamily)